MIDQDASHQARRHPEELVAVLPGRVLGAEPQVRLVHEVGRMQRVAGALMT